MSELKQIYLFAGDDQAKLDAARSRAYKRALEGGTAVESFLGRECTVEAISNSAAGLTLSVGRRFVLADGVESWRTGQLDTLAEAVSSISHDTTLIMICRAKASAKLIKLVENAGGEAREFTAPKPWQLPQWVVERAGELGLRIDAEAAEAVVERIGANQQRLLRELEKLAVAYNGEPISHSEVAELVSESALTRVYALGDALFEGQRSQALKIAEELKEQGEEGPRLLATLARQARMLLQASELVEAGHSQKALQEALRLTPYAAKKTFAKARNLSPNHLREAIVVLAELDFQLKGGGQLDSDWALTRSLGRVTV